MAQNEVDLAGLFQAVTQSLAENQEAFDRTDELNGNHGSNMLQTFQIISGALQQKSGATDSAALHYAAK
jgi:hypothetical protein